MLLLILSCSYEQTKKDTINKVENDTSKTSNEASISNEALISNEADVNTANEYGLIPLHKAVEERDLQTIQALIARKALKVSEYDLTELMHKAAKSGYADVVALLLQAGAYFNSVVNDKTALMTAVEENHIDVVKLLLDKNVDKNIKAWNEEKDTALMIAAKTNNKELVKLLLANNVIIYDGDDKKILAMPNIDSEIQQLILNKFEQNKEGILKAAKEGDAQTIQTLIEKGADINIKDNYDLTALMYASLNGNTEVVRVLLKEKIEVNAKTKSGSTALMFAAEKGHKDVVKLLLQGSPRAFINVNAQNKKGWTALMFAAKEGHTDVVLDFLEQKANTSLTNNRREKAADLAKNDEIRELINNTVVVSTNKAQYEDTIFFSGEMQ